MQGRSSNSWFGRHRVGVTLALILLFGAGLRVWYALPDPHKGRFWDERYSFENVEKILETWSLEPARGYYPAPIQSWPQALAVAASEQLAELTGVEWLDAVDERGRFTSTAFILVRMLAVIYGTLCLAVVFLIGRRMFSRDIGFFAALALAATPWHIHVSSKFKPDALLVLTVLLAFYWSLGAIERGGWRDHFLAGLGVALAASAKLLGVLIAVPLTVGSLWLAVRDRRRLARLVFAGVASLVTFAILNPYGRSYLWYANSLQDDYAMRAEWRGMTRASMPAEIGEYLFGFTVHGPFSGALAALGLLALLITAVRTGKLRPERRVERAMLVVFPVFYSAAYIAATPYFKGNNLVPIVPFTSLAAVWLAVSLWEGIAARFRLPHWSGGAAAALFAVVLALPGPIYNYRSLTPTTMDVALRFLRRGVGSAAGRVVFTEEIDLGMPLWDKAKPLARNASVIEVPRLHEIGEPRLARADGEVFLERRFGGAEAEFYRARIERVPEGRVRTIRPRRLRLRGPALVAIRHWRKPGTPWIELGLEPCAADDRICLVGTMPGEIQPSELVSLSVRIPAAVLGDHQPPSTIQVDGRPVPLLTGLGGLRVELFLTERFPLPEAGARVRLESDAPRADGRRVFVALRQWGPKRSAPEGSDPSDPSPPDSEPDEG